MSELPDARTAFLCYRRDDARGCAQAVNENLRATYPGQIRFDVDDEHGIPIGNDFEGDLDHKLRTCACLIALIGPNWVNARNLEGNRALEDENDWVRREIRTALNGGKTVVPVTLDGTPLPKPEELPQDIAGLLKGQQISIQTGAAFRVQCGMLSRRIWPLLQSPWFWLTVTAGGGAWLYFGWWLWSAAGEVGWGTLFTSIGVAALSSLTLLKKHESVQRVRSLLSYWYLSPLALAVLGTAYFIMAKTPVIAVEGLGPSFSVLRAGRLIAQNRMAGPFWLDPGASETALLIDVPDQANRCVTPHPVIWPPAQAVTRLSKDDPRNYALLAPDECVCSALQACGLNCSPDDPSSVDLVVKWKGGDKVFPNYQGEVIWVGGAVKANLAARTVCGNQARILRVPIAQLECGIQGAMDLEYRWEFRSNSPHAVQDMLDNNWNQIRIRSGLEPQPLRATPKGRAKFNVCPY